MFLPVSFRTKISALLLRLSRRLQKIRGRKFPVMPALDLIPKCPLSIIVVRFSDEFNHNIACSPCATNPLNQLIVVDNTSNVFYYSLSEAINAGLAQAKHDIVVVVHEDVYLPAGWQACLEFALSSLEPLDPNWGVIGTAGITAAGVSRGHYSDPNNYCNTFKLNECVTPVDSLDEHLMIFRKSRGYSMDALHPGIHGIGTDLVISAQRRGANCYVINAPSIHKYKDAQGEIITSIDKSPKIVDRANYAYKADKLCCDEYIRHKWNDLTPFSSMVTRYEPWQHPADQLDSVSPDILTHLDNPVILLGKGGGGSRLLSFLMQDCGVCLGTDVNISGDCMDMVIAVYQGVIEKFKCKAGWQKELVVPQLRLAAAKMLERMKPGERKLWGFKLPENLFLLQELNQAFPRARYIQMFRDPVNTCLRRTHMTARLDNQIGRITLPLAYREAGFPVSQILADSEALHMAYSTVHQLGLSLSFCRNHLDETRYREVFFEDLLTKPEQSLKSVSEWLGVQPESHTLAAEVDIKRASRPGTTYPADIEQKVKALLQPLMESLSYM